jgi:hypothetical protein
MPILSGSAEGEPLGGFQARVTARSVPGIKLIRDLSSNMAVGDRMAGAILERSTLEASSADRLIRTSPASRPPGGLPDRNWFRQIDSASEFSDREMNAVVQNSKPLVDVLTRTEPTAYQRQIRQRMKGDIGRKASSDRAASAGLLKRLRARSVMEPAVFNRVRAASTGLVRR